MKFLSKKTLVYIIFVIFASTGISYAQGNDAPTRELKDIDSVFLVFAAALVFIMQAGFCLLETGLARSKNSINIAMKNMTDFGVGVICFFLIGFAIMFGESQHGLFGLGNLAFTNAYDGAHPVWVFFLFQAMFASAAVTISSGAMAERTFFPGYVAYAAVACALLYPILGHWVWGGAAVDFGFGGGQGWLAKMGFTDFAGSTVVHVIGGSFSLAGIIVIGPRRGRFAEDGSARIFAGHNIPLATAGGFLLIFGWFGFNCGSMLMANADIGRIGVNTVLGACGGLMAGLYAHWIIKGWADVEVTMNGALGGLVSVTACCHVIPPWAALIVGVLGGTIVVQGSSLLQKFKLDDAVGAVPVHLFCGTWGTLCVALFNENGFSFPALGVQALGAFLISIAAFSSSWILFTIINKTIGLRASEDAQLQGLDFAEHSATAYPDFVINDLDHHD